MVTPSLTGQHKKYWGLPLQWPWDGEERSAVGKVFKTQNQKVIKCECIEDFQVLSLSGCPRECKQKEQDSIFRYRGRSSLEQDEQKMTHFVWAFGIFFPPQEITQNYAIEFGISAGPVLYLIQIR